MAILFKLMAVAMAITVAHLGYAAESKNLAPGFSSLPAGANIVLVSPDIELFSLSAGGVQEPKGDWTDLALKYVRSGISARMGKLNLKTREMTDDETDEFSEINALHAAVARSIALHHSGGGIFALPTKDGKLDWSLGDAVAPIRAKFGGDYALFVWMRDSYASAERKVAMVALALFGVGIVGGFQVGYASLVDLRTGQVMWFNRLLRGSGDLREAEPATETIATLLTDFPASK